MYLRSFVSCGLPLAALVVGLAPAAHAQGQVQDRLAVQTLFQNGQAKALASVEIKLEVELTVLGQKTTEHTTARAVGAVVDRGGLIMLRDSALRGDDVRRSLGDPGEADGKKKISVAISPAKIEVVLGQDDAVTRFEAAVAHRAPQLNLAFVRVTRLEQRLPEQVSWGKPPGSLGAPLYGLTKLAASYGHAPQAVIGLVSGKVLKPRAAWLVSGDLSVGAPAYALNGAAVGVVTRLTANPASSQDAEDEEDPLGVASALQRPRPKPPLLLLPVETVQAEIAAARAKVKDELLPEQQD